MNFGDVKIVVYDQSTQGIDEAEAAVRKLIKLGFQEIGINIHSNMIDEAIEIFEDGGTRIQDMGLAICFDEYNETLYRDKIRMGLKNEEGPSTLMVPGSGADINPLVQTALRQGIVCKIIPIEDREPLDAEILRERAGVGEEWSGRPPLGFKVKAGKLVRGENYQEIVSVLRAVDNGDLSKRAAADELDTSRRTINRALDNPDRYRYR